MLAGGITFMIVGAIITIFGFGAGLLGFDFAIPIGGSIFSLGVMLAIAGAIVNAIHEHKDAVLAEIRGEREDLRVGFKSLWNEMDKVRANTAAAAPPPGASSGVELPQGGQHLEPPPTPSPGFWVAGQSKQ